MEQLSTDRRGPDHALVEMRGISKRFGGVVALSRVDLKVYPGEVIGLVGDNGAGKSTLIKILAGAYQPDEGEIFFEDRRVHLHTPRAAKDLGIETSYQDLALVDTLDVAGNIFLGREPARWQLGRLRILDKQSMERHAEGLLNRLGISFASVRTKVEKLSGGQRQAVAVSRAIFTNPKLVILDEPTAALAVREVGRVLDLIRNLRTQGIAVIFISHTLHEIVSVTDRVFVLRKGQRVGDIPTEETSIDEIVKLMVGQEQNLVAEDRSR
jgi:ABC-type sugar transport system ATPase subunit